MRLFLSFQGSTVSVTETEIYSLLQTLSESQEFWLASNGRVCSNISKFENDQIINVICKLLGGKGGFGAKLKTEGGKKVRPNQNMFSRDLQGQPVAYSTINRQYEQFYRRRTIQNQRVEKQLKDFQVVSNTYKEDYVSSKLDSTYNAQIQENQRRLKQGLKVGMKKYLEKRMNEVEGQQKKSEKHGDNEKQEEVESAEKDEHEEDLVKDQLEATKRTKPIGNHKQEEGIPIKRVKLDQSDDNEQDNKNKPNNVKPQNQKLLSAKQKLKSLFKK